MRIDILTLSLTESILQRAQDDKLLELHFHDLREWGRGKYRQVDDRPYGGGAGMVLRVDVLVSALESILTDARGRNPKMQETKNKPYRIYLSPKGKKLTQTKVERLAKKHDWLILLCGHYEGIDQRVIDGGWIDEEISIGDYVLTGGELPAMVLIDAVARQIPGVLGKDESAEEGRRSIRITRARKNLKG